MFLLTSTSDLVQLVTGSAGAIDVHTTYVDLNAGAQTPLRTNTAQITTAATTTIIGSPGASTQRNAKYISIRNAHASIANAVTVHHTDGTNNETIFSCTLYPGDQLQFTELGGWKYLPNSNSVIVPGRLLLTTVHTTGTTHTTGLLTNTIRIRMTGGGGGGSGCTSVAAAGSAGGGGGAGGYGDKIFAVSPNTAYTYAIGAAGTGNSGAAGGNGGDSTFAVGATTVTAKGGTGAVVATASASVTSYAGGAGGVVGTNGDVNASGAPGCPGIMITVATVFASGSGGSGNYGSGGIGVTAVGNGSAGTGNGSGGGGAATGASAARTGGVGTVGIVIVDEYS